MVDPSGWRTERGGSGLAFTDPSNFKPSVNPIDFDASNVRQTNGNQSLENDSTVQRPCVLIDESSDSVQPSAFRAEFCWVPNGTARYASAGIVFGFEDSNNYFVWEVGAGDNNWDMELATVSGGSYSAVETREENGQDINDNYWLFHRIEVEPVGASDLRYKAFSSELSDYKSNGESALKQLIDFRWNKPPRRAGSLGVAYGHREDEISWLDGVQFYW